MDANKAFEAALYHYRKGIDLLNYPVAVPIEEQAVYTARASAHFGAGILALALAGAQHAGAGSQPDAQVVVVEEERGQSWDHQ